MSKGTKRTSGRPRKATFAEKQAIIDAFYISEGGDNPSVFTQRGIYKRLEEFPLSRTLNLFAHDFSKDPNVTAYIKKITAQATPTVDPTILPVFVPFDLESLLSKNIKAQVEILRQKDDYYRTVYHRAAIAISSFADVSRQLDIAKQEIGKIKQELEAMQQQNDELAKKLAEKKTEANEANAEVQRMRNYIRDHVEPTMAEAYLQDLGSRKRLEIPSVAEAVVTKPLVPIQSKSSSVLEIWKNTPKK